MPYQINRLARRIPLWLSALLLAACASAPPTPAPPAPPVYPPPPDEPRFIFERTLRYSSNVEPPRAGAGLRRFATGVDETLKGLVKPFGVVASQGRVYVTDSVQRAVVLFDIGGQRYQEIGRTPPGELAKPIGIDLSEIMGELYVADASLRRIVVFDLQGQFKRYIGGPNLFKRPSGVAVSADGQRVYVIDTGGVDTDAHHLYLFDTATADHLKTVGTRGGEPGQFNLPVQLTTSDDGRVHVVDKGNFRVQTFSREGDYLGTFGTIGRYPGQFFSPKGIATDRDGNIYVIDTAFGNVQIFTADGQLLMVLGQRGQSSAPGNYMLPAGIDVDETGRIYVADQFFRKVDIYRPIGAAPPDAGNR